MEGLGQSPGPPCPCPARCLCQPQAHLLSSKVRWNHDPHRAGQDGPAAWLRSASTPSGGPGVKAPGWEKRPSRWAWTFAGAERTFFRIPARCLFQSPLEEKKRGLPIRARGHWSKAWLGLTSTLWWPQVASVIRPHLTQPAPSKIPPGNLLSFFHILQRRRPWGPLRGGSGRGRRGDHIRTLGPGLPVMPRGPLSPRGPWTNGREDRWAPALCARRVHPPPARQAPHHRAQSGGRPPPRVTVGPRCPRGPGFPGVPCNQRRVSVSLAARLPLGG